VIVLIGIAVGQPLSWVLPAASVFGFVLGLAAMLVTVKLMFQTSLLHALVAWLLGAVLSLLIVGAGMLVLAR